MELIGIFSILGFGFILGIKHAIEPDHVIAVSTIASQSKKLYRSSLTGVFWGIGHTVTLLLVGISIILMKGEIPEVLAMSLEFLVGIMLVYFGFSAILSCKNVPICSDEELPKYDSYYKTRYQKHKPYIKSLFMGFVHGLAGSAALVLMTISTVESVSEGFFFILIFGAGTVIGMLCFTTVLGIPFVLSSKKVRINKVLTQTTGVISTVFGFYYMYDLGVTEGLFKIWMP